MLDSSLGLEAGDIFTWENYPLFEHQQKDRRWFIFLGSQSLEAVVYEVTTTTQTQHYGDSGDRRDNNFFTIEAGVGGLTADSVVDLTDYFESIPENVMNGCADDITKQGRLPQEVINTLVYHIQKDKGMNKLIKRDIYRYLQESGFSVNVK